MKPISTAFWWTSRLLPRSRSTTLSPTKPWAVRRPARELARPGPRADERHEGTRRSLSDLQVAIRLPGRDDQDLPAPRADRGDDSSTRRELVLPRIRNLRGARGRQDAVVRSPLGIAEAAIADDDGHGREARLGEVRPSPFGKPRDAFGREIHRLAHQSVTASAADKLSVTQGPGGQSGPSRGPALPRSREVPPSRSLSSIRSPRPGTRPARR